MPKVVLVVGPVGSLTASYRSQADKAAAAAAAAGAQVVKVYSPDATWPAVKRAAEGASIVVYLGHGNGWPSRYRDELYPPTQNGFGLNPVAGGDDSSHQYFGEAFIDDLDLAPNAIVVLSHLCYASGNTEPGLPEGTSDQAVQRVDNFAAGFLRAGARAVVAEGHMGPAYYVKSLLTTGLTIEQIWNRSPNANGHTFGVASVRSPGYTLRLDPDTARGGYFRSLVSAGVSAAALRSGATGNAGAPVVGPPAQPSLASLGLRFGTPSLRALPIAGTATKLTLALPKAGLRAMPKGAQVGVRWDPILLDPEPAAEPVPSPVAGPSPSPSAVPSPSGSPEPSATPDPDASVPDVELVVPEHVGAVVTLTTVRSSPTGLVLDVRYPSAPGLYRLVSTLHTPSGVAYDAATQTLLTPMIVRVAGPVAVAYGSPASLSAAAGAATPLAVRVVNAGSEAWDAVATTPSELRGEALLTWLRTSRVPAQLVATWVSAEALPVPVPVSAVLDLEATVPGSGSVVQLDLVSPPVAGEYLLLLDVVTPAHGSLSALGNAPALVRVSVSPAPAASPEPAPATPDTRN